MWRLKRPSSVSPSFILSILNGSYYNIAGISRHQFPIWCQKPVYTRVDNHLGSLQAVTLFSGLQNGFTHPLRSFSTLTGMAQAGDPAILSFEIVNVIGAGRYVDAWKLLEQHLQTVGFPSKNVVSRLVVGFAETHDVQWLEKAYGMVEQAFEENEMDSLEKRPLIYLSLVLAKCGFPVHASTILRKLVERKMYPCVSALSAVLAHMSQTASGAYLAAELILEIGYLFLFGRIDPKTKSNAPINKSDAPSKKRIAPQKKWYEERRKRYASERNSNAHFIAMKPNTTAFSIALAGCLLFGATGKAQQLLDLMPRIGVKADVDLLIVVANIYERNGQTEELRRLQCHIDKAVNLTDNHLRQFYNCLLTCHLKFGDLDSASNAVLEMLSKVKKLRDPLAAAVEATAMQMHPVLESDALGRKISIKKPFISYEEFSRDKRYVKPGIEALRVLDILLVKLLMQVELFTIKRGIFQTAGETIYVKLVKAFLEAGKSKDLAEFLIKAEKENSSEDVAEFPVKEEKKDSSVPNDDSALVHVINSCISLGCLDQARNLLDEMRDAGVRASSSVYASLLKAYCKADQAGKATTLLRDAEKAGIQIDRSCYEPLIINLFQETKEAQILGDGNQES